MRISVVPHAGTWIEMILTEEKLQVLRVVPHAGTWIEIFLSGVPKILE